MGGRRTYGVAGVIGLAAALMVSRGGLRSPRVVSAQGQKPAAKEVPKFAVVPGWAKIPNGWVLGQVASAAADEKDHIWILHRPRVVRAGPVHGPERRVDEADLRAGDHAPSRAVPVLGEPVLPVAPHRPHVVRGDLGDVTEGTRAVDHPVRSHVEVRIRLDPFPAVAVPVLTG